MLEINKLCKSIKIKLTKPTCSICCYKIVSCLGAVVAVIV
jgi:hypothetical protein